MPHNFLGTELKVNTFRKGRISDQFDEPTYLTFAIDFKFESTAPSTALIIDESRLWDSPLFDERNFTEEDSTAGNNAMQFLKNRGYTAQAAGIKQFKEILRYLTFDAPWYFQSITGIPAMFKASSDVSSGDRTKGVILEVKTLEAVDLRIFELAALYRNSIYDLKFRRERVPDNLRWFSMDIYLAEFRNLRYRLPQAASAIAQLTGVNTAAIGNAVTSIRETANTVSGLAGAIGGDRQGGLELASVFKQFGYIKFSCRQCEFDFSDSLPIGSDLTVGGQSRTAESNKFKIKVGYVEEEAKFGDGTVVYDDNVKTDVKTTWGERQQAALLESSAGAIFSAGQNLVSGIGSFGSGNKSKNDSPSEFGRKAKESLASIGNATGINTALAAAVSLFDPPIDNLGEVHPYGYASNGDEVPNRPAPSGGKQYGPEKPKPPVTDLGDANTIGYASNGDKVPNRPPEPNGNIYE